MKVPFRKIKDGIAIDIKVEPRSSRKGVAGVMGNMLKVKLTAPPVEGAANEQLIEVLSEALGVKKSSIRIAKGGSSKKKVVEISGVGDLGEI